MYHEIVTHEYGNIYVSDNLDDFIVHGLVYLLVVLIVPDMLAGFKQSLL